MLSWFEPIELMKESRGKLISSVSQKLSLFQKAPRLAEVARRIVDD
jgi:hypothetical protein